MSRSPYSVLLLAYGQSNADVYPASPVVPCAAFDDPRIVTFSDGNGFRGPTGRAHDFRDVDLVATAIASENTVICRNYQSFQVAAAARLLHEVNDPGLRQVIIRSEARGGRRIDGIISKQGVHQEGILTNLDGSDSQLLLNALDSIRLAAELAERRGAPLRRLFLNFIHGEANRSDSRDAYRAGLDRLIARIERDPLLGSLPLDWLILDPAGTSGRGSGNNWPCRQAMRDVADARPNLHLIGAGYAYPLDDVIHYGSESRVLFGEHFGAAAAHLLARDKGQGGALGWTLDAPAVSRAVLSGQEVDLELSGPEAFELVPGMADAGLTVEGFATTAAAGCRVTGVRQTGPRSVRITLDQPPLPRERAALSYAYQLLRRDDPRDDGPMPAGRGGWRSVKALDSLALPGRRIHQWVPGFSIPFAEMQTG